MADKQPEEKQFSLKESEMRMLMGIEELKNQQMSLFLSFIAMERMAYTVTLNTRFRVENNTLYIAEAAPEQPQPAAPDAPNVSTGDTPTAEAMKGKK